MLRFCSKCDSYLPKNSIICPRCAHISLYDDKETFFGFINNLISREKVEEKKRVSREKVPCKVVDVGPELVTLECSYPKFEEGDVIGYIASENLIDPLGVVIGGGTVLTVALHRSTALNEGQRLELCETEVLIGYDLQMELIEKMEKGELNEIEQKVSSIIFENPKLGELNRVELVDTKDVKDDHLLDESQIAAVESILGLRNGELLLIIGPPGTGKTRVIAKAALELMKKGEGF